MPLAGRQGRRRRYGLTGLAGTAAAAWGATFGLDVANVEDHIWVCTLTLAAVCTLATLEFQLVLMLSALLGGVNERLDRAHQAIARLYADQPPAPDVTPPPWQGLRPVDGGARAPRNARRASQ